MNTKSKYNFKEAKLGSDFAKEKMADFQKLIQNSQSFTVLSMPGVGVSYFLRYLVTQDFARFFHIDLYSLPALTKEEFYKLTYKELSGKNGGTLEDCRKALEEIVKKEQKICIVFSRFDQLKKEFDRDFFANIQSLTNIAPVKTCLIFTSIKPLYEIAPEAISGGNLPFYSKTVYFKPFNSEDIKTLLKLEAQYPNFPKNLDKLINLSGGHIQLLHILLNSQKQQNLLLDKFVKLQMKDLIDYLDYSQKKALQKIALGKKLDDIDDYLLGVGMVKNNQIFTPLLSQYIKTNIPVKLPIKESELFKLLRKNIGNTVSKDEIFASVWPDSENATDWALDALIYRLRKHPFMQSHSYIIESHKKVGYTLIQT